MDDLKVEYYDGSAWQTDVEERFEVTGGKATDTLTHDAAGNLTYDGLQQYTCDAWNRLVKVECACRDAVGDVTAV